MKLGYIHLRMTIGPILGNLRQIWMNFIRTIIHMFAMRPDIIALRMRISGIKQLHIAIWPGPIRMLTIV